MAMRFGDRLRELRHAAGLTQERLAKMVGMALSSLRALEQGQRRPSWPSVVRLARAMGKTSAVFDECDEVTKKGPLRRRGPSAKRRRPAQSK